MRLLIFTIFLIPLSLHAQSDILDTGHKAKITTIAVSSDGKLLATGSWDRTIKIWNIAQRRLVTTIPNNYPVSQIEFTPDSKYIAAIFRDNDGSFWPIGEILFYDLANKEKLNASLLAHPSNIYKIDFSNKGKKISIAGMNKDFSRPAVYVNNYKMTSTSVWKEDFKRLNNFEDNIYGALFFPADNDLLTYGVRKANIKKVNIDTGFESKSFEHKRIIQTADISHDGKIIALGEGIARDFNGEPDAQFYFYNLSETDKSYKSTTCPLHVYDLKFRPNSYDVTLSCKSSLKIFLNEEREIREAKKINKEVEAFDFSPDGDDIFIAQEDKILIWTYANFVEETSLTK